MAMLYQQKFSRHGATILVSECGVEEKAIIENVGRMPFAPPGKNPVLRNSPDIAYDLSLVFQRVAESSIKGCPNGESDCEVDSEVGLVVKPWFFPSETVSTVMVDWDSPSIK